MNSAARRALELDQAFALLRRYLASDLGRKQLELFTASPWLANPAEAETALAEIGEAMDWRRAAEGAARQTLTPLPRFEGLEDLHGTAEQLETADSVLEAHQLYALLQLLERAEEVRRRLSSERANRPRLCVHADRIAEFAPLLSELGGKILPNGEVSDLASPALGRIRRQVEQQRKNIHRTLERFVRKHYDQGILQDDYATIRDGRSVVPVKASWQGRVEGVIHTASATGRTVFVEPLETITENNKLLRLLEDERREIRRILREMTARLREQKDEVREAVRTLGELELLFAKAAFGRAFGCCLPRFSDDSLRLEWARHPVLQDVLARDGKKAKPLSVRLADGRRVLVVSGPNAGGKTVVLKTVGVIALMARCGLPVPAAEASMPWFEETLADIGDDQSIGAGLSTFSAHIQTLKHMLTAAGGRSLVIIDELAGATDPTEGGAFAIAVVEHLIERGAFVLVSTHLPALKVHAANSDRILSAAMGFNRETLSPTHELLAGVPGESAGLAVAERLGIPKSVIQRARQALAGREEEAAKFLSELRGRIEENQAAAREIELAKHHLEERERELEKRLSDREKKKLAELEHRFAQTLRRAQTENQQQLQAAVARLDEAQSAGKRQAVNARREATRAQRESLGRLEAAASEALGKTPAATPDPAAVGVTPGARVTLGGFGVEGEVLRSLDHGRWEVQVGQLKMQVSADDITHVLDAAEKPSGSLPDGVTFQSSTAGKSLAELSEINLIGQHVEEAEAAVDKFLDEALLADVLRLRVVHGHGTNALRRALWKMFADHPQVARFYQAEQNEGGGGATIVELRE